MFKYILMAALVSIVSGCVTSDRGTLYSQSVTSRSVRDKRVAQMTARTPSKPVKSVQNIKPGLILGAAY